MMLEIKNLHKYYSDKAIFEDISMEIPSKSIISLKGKNGIGKTTLLNILGGISEFSGDLIINGTDYEKDLLNYMKKTSIIPNHPFLYDYLTVSEMIELVDSMTKFDNTKLIHELIFLLRLEEFNDDLIKNLSLGTKQKVAFIIGFMNHPELILIDEPFVNFDSISLSNILKFIIDYLKKTNSIIIFSTHSTEVNIQAMVTHSMEIENKKLVVLRKKN